MLESKAILIIAVREAVAVVVDAVLAAGLGVLRTANGAPLTVGVGAVDQLVAVIVHAVGALGLLGDGARGGWILARSGLFHDPSPIAHYDVAGLGGGQAHRLAGTIKGLLTHEGDFDLGDAAGRQLLARDGLAAGLGQGLSGDFIDDARSIVDVFSRAESEVRNDQDATLTIFTVNFTGGGELVAQRSHQTSRRDGPGHRESTIEAVMHLRAALVQNRVHEAHQDELGTLPVLGNTLRQHLAIGLDFGLFGLAVAGQEIETLAGVHGTHEERLAEGAHRLHVTGNLGGLGDHRVDGQEKNRKNEKVELAHD